MASMTFTLLFVSFLFVVSAGSAVSGISTSPLQVFISADPQWGAAVLTVAFTSSVGGGSAPYAYRWSFGDGSVSSDQASPIHAYLYPGTYNATLVVTDSSGSRLGAAVTITVLYGQITTVIGGTTYVTSCEVGCEATGQATATYTSSEQPMFTTSDMILGVLLVAAMCLVYAIRRLDKKRKSIA
jgi:PKD repeat protein